jgi:hypothetical protein
MTAQTPAQRQAQRKARQIAAGLKMFKRWAHQDDHGALSTAADALERQRIERTLAGAARK